MVRSLSQLWLPLYGAICFALVYMLLRRAELDVYSLRPWLREGRALESLPALLWLVAALLAIGLAMRLRARRRRAVGWLLFSAASLFLALEEAGWGRESVLGWQAFARSDDRDLHGPVVDLVGRFLVTVRLETAITYAGLFVAATVAALALGFWLADKRRARVESPEGRPGSALPRLFLFLGIAWLVLANVLDTFDWFQHLFRDEMQIAKWAAEESAEVLAAVAFLFAVASGVQLELAQGDAT